MDNGRGDELGKMDGSKRREKCGIRHASFEGEEGRNERRKRSPAQARGG